MKADRPDFKSYVIGYAASVYLTITAYVLVAGHALTPVGLTTAVIGLGLLQFLIQMIFFLHLGRESKPYWKLIVFGFMTLVVAILVLGSLWIMNNLNYRMTPQQIDNYLNTQDGF